MNNRDNQVQDTASLHENAVQAIAKGEVAQLPKRTRKKADKRFQGVHKHIVVDPLVMREARLLTMLGTYSRIEIIDSETVMVR